MFFFYEHVPRHVRDLVKNHHCLGPLHTRAKSRDHEIVGAQKKVSKGRPNTPLGPLHTMAVQVERPWDWVAKLSTIVWVPIHVRHKLPSRVRRLLQKVILFKCNGLWTLAIVWRVDRTLGFLQFDWWKSTASWPSAIVWSPPQCSVVTDPRV
jgi:hypothetical protein